jgi:hypothetical protein
VGSFIVQTFVRLDGVKSCSDSICF